ncbi:helix-turn-helix transcriptional regulator [Enterococcus pseudoavium]|uniref:Helix-turn-helix transcriptional regulator n=2 Tax=Enterococcus TaxID=1350 RepID=A0AAE4I4U9_9ENTE|nr:MULTISPECIES: helix-turn-helix transcriptional regulator [Enterococcus]MDT2595600.1 helix-turn-helix transcriptional regulator [Enterococcus dongliensis]MDT2646411.1 helix-turn-helix transcriptional regulator [Enterococcus dongliensis]MDT2669582.1 helix-turn-helix transcriptional regulator [Enterococcus dongliensis]MDT2675241.1 helix-turn-helix transcriptional regulator [Enterococcus dongliensis]MDT2737924.1 helix-turn-helix transcriptional regulator [Enterococcus pseudoavium]
MEILLERIKLLCKSRGITVSQLEDNLDLPSNTIYQWKKRIPNTERLKKVADYFNTSLDYLLGRTDNQYAGLSPEQRKLTIKEALESAMGKDGKEIDADDIPTLTRIIEAYLDGKN